MDNVISILHFDSNVKEIFTNTKKRRGRHGGRVAAIKSIVLTRDATPRDATPRDATPRDAPRLALEIPAASPPLSESQAQNNSCIQDNSTHQNPHCITHSLTCNLGKTS